jgi:hypothetical protein
MPENVCKVVCSLGSAGWETCGVCVVWQPTANRSASIGDRFIIFFFAANDQALRRL